MKGTNIPAARVLWIIKVVSKSPVVRQASERDSDLGFGMMEASSLIRLANISVCIIGVMPTAPKTPRLRLATEVTAIVLSILAAFAIDAWWEDVQQQKHLESVLGILESGFSENIVLLGENIDYVSADREYLKHFIDMSPEEAIEIPLDRSFATLEAIWRPGTNFSNNSFLIATLESENLPLLQYPQLQEAVSQWRAEIGELNERALQLAETEREGLRALAYHAEVRTVLAMTKDDVRELSGHVMRNVREDQNVMAIAGRKVFLAQLHLDSLRLLQERSESILDLIRQAMQ